MAKMQSLARIDLEASDADRISLAQLDPTRFTAAPFERSPGSRALKRLFDLVAATIFLIVTAPISLLVATLIKLHDGGPVLFRQTRVGRGGTVFVLCKFRSMRVDAEADTGPVWAQRDDPRVTAIGRWMRPFGIDEIPQVWNVLRGDMSFVGPRPERPEFVHTLEAAIPLVRPPPRGAARHHRLGAGELSVRRHRRRGAPEARIRPVLPDSRLRADGSRDHAAHAPQHDSSREPTGPIDVINALTVDVEDYFHPNAMDGVVPPSQWDAMPHRVEANTRRMLDLLDECGVHATFFVLGWVAERWPQLISDIERRGHEVACHGFAHRLVYQLGREPFRDDVLRARSVLEDIVGHRIAGFRAASYSIVDSTLWALDVLIDLGFTYDSSIFPIRHDLYGIPSFSRTPVRMRARCGRDSRDPAVDGAAAGTQLAGRRRRLLPPLPVLADAPRHRVAQSARRTRRHGLRAPVGARRRSTAAARRPARPPAQYTNLHRTEARLRRLLREFRFAPVRDVFGACAA